MIAARNKPVKIRRPVQATARTQFSMGSIVESRFEVANLRRRALVGGERSSRRELRERCCPLDKKFLESSEHR